MGGSTLQPPPPKKLGSKNMQNLARFRTTWKFGGEYLRNGWRYSKSDFYFIYRDSSCVRQNKSSEVWSSNRVIGDIDMKSYRLSRIDLYIAAQKAQPFGGAFVEC